MTTSSTSAPDDQPRFVSLRWRVLLPVTLLLLVTAMIGAYALGSRLAAGFAISETNVLLQSTQAVQRRSSELYTRMRAEAQRVAFTEGIAAALGGTEPTALYPTLETLAATAELDSILLVDADGREVAGVLRVQDALVDDYSLSSGTALTDENLVQQLLAVDTEEANAGSGWWVTPQGTMLYVGVPVQRDDAVAGAALVGVRLDSVAENLQASAIADVTLYAANGRVLQTTLTLDDNTLTGLGLSATTVQQVLDSEQPVAAGLQLGETPYRATYTPFTFGGQTLGIAGTLMPDNVPFAQAIGQQVAASLAAGMAGAAVIATFVFVNRAALRAETIAQTAQALATGERQQRTGLQATDEISAIGAALDTFADAMHEREDTLSGELQRKRRERNYLIAVLHALPDGVIVRDRDGATLLMNAQARHLLADESLALDVTDALPSDAPLAAGIYALGKPQNIAQGKRMLRVQAAAVQSPSGKRLGTVLLLRDITDDVQQTQAQEDLLAQLSADVQQPLMTLAQQGAGDTSLPMREFAREIARHTASLQRMIVEMRELTRYTRHDVEHTMRSLPVERLIWALANDWRQIAQATDCELRVIINHANLHILGDESRLRWAIGNVVDNAIKYTPPGGTVTLEVHDIMDERVHLRVRDNGVGISSDDLPHLFMPFYRGTPVTDDGQAILVPGMGQGLPTAKHVIDAHGGAMKVKSRVGVGTAVYMALPLTSGESYVLPDASTAVMEGETVQLAPDELPFDD